MQSRSFEPYIFGFAADVDAWPSLSDDLLRLVILVYLFFIAVHDTKQKHFFSVVEAAVHMWHDAVQRFSTSTRTAPNVLAFESFLMLPNVSKLLFDQHLVILLAQIAPDMSLHEVMPPIIRL